MTRGGDTLWRWYLYVGLLTDMEVEVGVEVTRQDSGMQPEGNVLGHVAHGIAYPLH
jgi:hypothetical protein